MIKFNHLVGLSIVALVFHLSSCGKKDDGKPSHKGTQASTNEVTTPTFKETYKKLRDSESELKKMNLVFQDQKSNEVIVVIWASHSYQTRKNDDLRLSKAEKKNLYTRIFSNLDFYSQAVRDLIKNYPIKLSETEIASFSARANFAQDQRIAMQKEIQD